MSGPFQFYRVVNALSLDVVTGAIVSALFFARVHSVSLSPYVAFALALTVWIIYTVDHLRDARRICAPAVTYRHAYHQRYFKPISYFLALAVVIDVVAAWMLPIRVLVWGLALSSAVLVYLLAVRRLRVMKEFYVAVLYTAGVTLPTVALAPEKTTMHSFLLMGQLFLLAFINLLLFSWFDRLSDRQNKQYSIVTGAGEPLTRALIWSLISLSLVTSVYMSIVFPEQYFPAVITTAMGIGFLLIFNFRDSLAKNDVHRLLGDAVFMVPLLSLIWTEWPG